MTIENPKRRRLGCFLGRLVGLFFFRFSGERQDLIHLEEVIRGYGDDEVRPEAETVLLYRVVGEDREQDPER